MAGVGKLLKQAQKLQKQMASLQEDLSQKTFEVQGGGGAVSVIINGQSEILKLSIDEEFLKEDKELVEETLLSTLQEAIKTSKEANESEMKKISQGMGIPGLM